MRTLDSFADARPANHTRVSQHSLHTLPDSASSSHDPMAPDDDDEDDDGMSIHSSRSDKSLETAGLVPRLSDDDDRAIRKGKYEGGLQNGKAAASASGGNSYTDVEAIIDDEEFNDESIRDRPPADRRRDSRRKASVFSRTWHISREVR
jgi:hypothetical protein